MGKPKAPDKPAVQAQTETPENQAATVHILQAKNEALEAQVVDLMDQLETERQARTELQLKVAALESRIEATGTSVSFKAATPPPVGRPVVEVAGQQLRFKLGRFSVDGRTVLASEAAEDQEFVEQLVAQFPNLFEAVA